MQKKFLSLPQQNLVKYPIRALVANNFFVDLLLLIGLDSPADHTGDVDFFATNALIKRIY